MIIMHQMNRNYAEKKYTRLERDLMKSLGRNFRTLIIISVLIAIGIFIFLISGMDHQPIDPSGNGIITENMTPVVPMMIDADFNIMEANVSEVKYINSTPVTFEDMQMYPELERYMHGVNDDPDVWYRGWRYVNAFPGNLSTYDVLVKKICKGKSIFECNRGTLFEYHNQYYHVSIQEYGALQRTPNW